MAKFITSNELNSEIEKIFTNTQAHLTLISPYFKLHERYISALKTKLNNPEIEIIIVFGKNEDDYSKSLKAEDFNFFKDFPNIEIRYEKRLHAKYYANESTAILTSMNLYSFSQDNNIEAGVLTNTSFLGNIASKLINSEENFDMQTWNYFQRVIDQSDLLFKKVPVYDKGIIGIMKKYKESVIEIDELSNFFSGKTISSNKKATSSQENIVHQTSSDKKNNGYCIRTGKEIPFNTSKPYSDEAFKSWSQFKNEDYEEKFCHYSGEPSNGETSMAKPILRKNWTKAKKDFNL